MKSADGKAGFTLLELLIMLVVIALLIGAVLAVMNIIRAASIRGALTDIEKANSAVTNFRGKYAGMPGDITAARAIEFALSKAGDSNATGAPGLRDGNSILEGGAENSIALAGENALFWRDLANAALYEGHYDGIGSSVGPSAAITKRTVQHYLPNSQLRQGASLYAYALRGVNYFYLSTLTATITAGAVSTAAAATAFEAKNMDEKIDDGMPSTGLMRAYSNLATLQPGAQESPSNCVLNTLPASYNVTDKWTSAENNVVCQLQVRPGGF